MSLVTTALSQIPFLNSCDTSRLQMVAKYFGGQACPHISNEIPKLVPIESYKASVFSDGRFIKFADDDGYVVYSNDNILVVYYTNLNKIETYHTPEYKHISTIFGTKLHYKIKQNKKFKKGQLLFEYAGFKNGIPTSGINARVAFIPLHFLNHEDAIIVSESFSKKFKFYSYEELYIPIYENTKLVPNSKGKLLPDIGDEFEIDEIIIATKEIDNTKSNNIFDVLTTTIPDIKSEKTKVSLYRAKVVSIDVYKMTKNKFCFDKQTSEILEKLWKRKQEKIENIRQELSVNLNDKEQVETIIKRYYTIRKVRTKDIANTKNLVYVIKLTLVYEEPLLVGDKLSTRGANKGVISKIVPDELMPVDEYGNRIDVIISPLAIPSRMNINQIYELYLAELVDYAEKRLNEGDSETAFNIILDITSKFGKSYYSITKKFIEAVRNNSELFEKFIKDVKDNGLYIVVDNFKDKNVTKKDILELYEKYNIKPIRKIKYSPRKLKSYMTGISSTYLPEECEVDACVGILYMYRLFKIARYLLNARAVGPYHSILKVPTKGKAKQGGSKIGNNEIDALLSYDSKYVLKEFLTIKADDHEYKINFLDSLIKDGKFQMGDKESFSFVLQTINSLSKALFIDLSSLSDLDKINRDDKNVDK